MINLKTLFPYIFGLVSLIISIGVIGQGKPVEAELLPSPAASATPLPQPERFPGAAKLVRCRALSQPRFFFYRSSSDNVEKSLIISGTVYASDLTPLPNALVEIWQADNRADYPYYSITFSDRLRTDEAGHYEMTRMELARLGHSYLHYWVTYRGYCPLLMHIHLITELPAQSIKRPIFAKVVEITGPVLQGPVDIVLPVPPPKP